MKRSRSYTLALLVSLLVLRTASPALGATVKDIRWETKPAYTRVVIELSEGVPVVKRDLTRDRQMYVDLYKITTPHKSLSVPIDNGVVNTLLIVDFRQKQVLRLIFWFDVPQVTYTVQQIGDPARVVIDIFHPANGARRVAERAGPQPAVRRNGKKIVVLDPGHGGSDPGAISSIKVDWEGKSQQLEEKDITLKLALRLKALIDQTPNMVAIMTRDSDRFVSLDDRIRFADRYKGDIFISIHYNSTRGWRSRASTRGMEIYYQDPESAAVDKKQLAKEANNDAKLLKVLEQSSREMSEERIASSYLLTKCLEIQFGYNYYFRKYLRGIKTDQFRVLKNQHNRPSVLLEVGFLSHSSEVKELIKASNQEIAARCVFNAINQYFATTDKRFKAYKLQVPPK